MSQLDFWNSLISNDAVNLQEKCSDWKEAIELCFQPLLKNKIIKASYIDGVIKSTLEFGPYYIICPNVAMPHANPKTGANEDGFSLLTLQKPVNFDNHEISILIGFAAKNNEVHLSVALPQIVAIFEDSNVVEEIKNAKNIKELEMIIKKIDYYKYIK